MIQPDPSNMILSLRRAATGRARECDAVAAAALDHCGKAYKITRELTSSFIDCSTVVSQAHWTGGAIRVPFIAESQRLANNATDIASSNEMLPGDLIIAYPSSKEAPGGRHNHVALFLGSDCLGIHWAIEAKEGRVCGLNPLDNIQRDGGIRRFCPNPLQHFDYGSWSRLTSAVPKLGRLGARLTARYDQYTRHRGTDIYSDVPTLVESPISGEISAIERKNGTAYSLWIVNGPQKVAINLKPINIFKGLSEGSKVELGQPLGPLGSPAIIPGGCNHIPSYKGKIFLHIETWAPDGLGSRPASGINRHNALMDAAFDEWRASDSVYSIKLGILGSPLFP